MKEGFLHKNNILTDAIDNDVDWIKNASQTINVNYALSNSFGFGGINTTLTLKK